MKKITRRSFIASSGMLAAALPLGSSAFDFVPSSGKAFHFMLLGDIHYDKLYHHDMNYINEKYPNDISQIRNYSLVTERYLPKLMEVVKKKGEIGNSDFYIQLGDFVEGLCGSKKLAELQTTEFIEFIKEQELKRPFFVIKGNHDITGEGAKEVYDETVLPWQSGEHKKKLDHSCASFVYKNSRFVFFDCYQADKSLEWLKEDLKNMKEERLFFSVHMPLIPFNARSTWHVYSKPSEKQKRHELLELLGKYNSIVLCGHLHKTAVLKRETQSGKIIQVCLGSVMNPEQKEVKDHLVGIDTYNEDLVNLEPDFHPKSLEERKTIINTEKPFIKFFEYADFCGYSEMKVSDKGNILFTLYQNSNATPWKSFDLSAL